MNNSDTKLTIKTIVAVNKLRFNDQSIFKLPEEIQLDKNVILTPLNIIKQREY